jgi:hypothetical protein
MAGTFFESTAAITSSGELEASFGCQFLFMEIVL